MLYVANVNREKGEVEIGDTNDMRYPSSNMSSDMYGYRPTIVPIDAVISAGSNYDIKGVTGNTVEVFDMQKYIEDKMADDRAHGIESLYVLEGEVGKYCAIILKLCVMKDLGNITYEVLDGTVEIERFKSRNSCYKVKLPDSVKCIDDNAFRWEYEPGYEAAKEDNGVISPTCYLDNCIKTNLGPQAISGITEINLDNVRYIGRKAFYGCAGLQEVTLSGVATATVLQKTVIKEGRDGAVVGSFDEVETLTVSDPMPTLINQEAFAYCYGLNKIIVKDNVDMESNIFDSCISVKTVDLADYDFNDSPEPFALKTSIHKFLPLEPSEIELIWPKKSLSFDATSIIGRNFLPRATRITLYGVKECDNTMLGEPFAYCKEFTINYKLIFRDSSVSALVEYFKMIAEKYASEVNCTKSEDNSKIYYRYMPTNPELDDKDTPALEVTIYKNGMSTEKSSTDDPRAITSLFN